MHNPLREIIRRHSQPLLPQPTAETPRLKKLNNVQAVLFDIYGTLFISASGEVGTVQEEITGGAFSAALASVGMSFHADDAIGRDQFTSIIRSMHSESHGKGIDFSEVDIVAVWRETLAELIAAGLVAPCNPDDSLLRQLAVEYEVRNNPVWPMPGSDSSLQSLKKRDISLGIISNAQFFTLELFPVFLGAEVHGLGFHPDLQFFSYQHGRAKPGQFLFEFAVERLRGMNIAPSEVLYVGNDMLNDILPAKQVGFRTALFAGDARSLRKRETDARIAGVVPDVVLTELVQLLECF